MANSAKRTPARKASPRPVPSAASAAPARPAQQELEDAEDAHPATEEAAPPAIDSALDAWSASTAREQLAWQINLCRAMLRSAKAVRQVQVEAAEHAEQAQMRAADQLLSARGVSEFAELQFALWRTNAEEATQYWSRLGETAVRSAAEALQESAAGWMRVSEAAWEGLSQWSRWQASVPQTAEVVEAEVEHVANPLNASPWVWPAQEAARQAFDVAAGAWRDWLSAANGNAGQPH
jgi:hypothetical protein